MKLLKGKINIPKRPGEPDRSLADIKDKRMLNWSPVSTNQGIKILLDNINYWKVH